MRRRHWIVGVGWGLVDWHTAGAQPVDVAAVEAKAPPLPALGTPWPVPAMTRLDGSRFEPAHAEGRVLVLYWWASTCPFCAVTSPHVERFWRTHAAQPGWILLTLSIDRTIQAARQYVQQRGYTFPCAWVTPEVQRAMPKPKGLPITLVRDRDGHIVMAERGQLFPEDVDAIARWL